MPLNQEAKRRAFQSIRENFGNKALMNPNAKPIQQNTDSVQNAINTQRQNNTQQSSTMLQGLQEENPTTEQSQAVRDQVLKTRPELGDNPEFHQMSGKQARQLLLRE